MLVAELQTTHSIRTLNYDLSFTGITASRSGRGQIHWTKIVSSKSISQSEGTVDGSTLLAISRNRRTRDKCSGWAERIQYSTSAQCSSRCDARANGHRFTAFAGVYERWGALLRNWTAHVLNCIDCSGEERLRLSEMRGDSGTDGGAAVRTPLSLSVPLRWGGGDGDGATGPQRLSVVRLENETRVAVAYSTYHIA